MIQIDRIFYLLNVLILEQVVIEHLLGILHCTGIYEGTPKIISVVIAV